MDMNKNKYSNWPYDPEKEERTLFQMVLFIFLLLLAAFCAGEILSDMGYNLTKLIKMAP